VIENFIGTKRKVDIFIRTKNIIKKGNTCFFLKLLGRDQLRGHNCIT